MGQQNLLNCSYQPYYTINKSYNLSRFQKPDRKTMQKTIFTCMTAHQANIQEAKQQGALYKIIARNKNEGKVSLSSLRTSIYMGKKKHPIKFIVLQSLNLIANIKN